MSNTRFFVQQIRDRIEYIAVIILIAVLVSFGVTITQEPEYEASARVLVIQKQENVDAFTASKSADYLTAILEEAIYSESFFQTLISKDQSLADDFSTEPKKRKEQWRETVTTDIINDKGILAVSIFDADRDEAQQLSEIVMTTLIEEAPTYHGAGNSVTIRLIDNPVTSTRPVRPSVFANIAAGLFVGIALSAALVLLSWRGKLKELGLHPEAEEAEDINFLADGHVAPKPSRHVTSENFDQPEKKKEEVQKDDKTKVESKDTQNPPRDMNQSILQWMQKDK